LYLIATSLVRSKYTADQVFTMFKEQHHIETAHHQWKAPIRLRPIFLHKVQRIESLILVQFIALMAFYLLQRQYRQRSRRPDCRTTAETLIRQFSFVPISLREQNGQTVVSIFRPSLMQAEILSTLAHPHLATQLEAATQCPADHG
jgi:transposase